MIFDRTMTGKSLIKCQRFHGFPIEIRRCGREREIEEKNKNHRKLTFRSRRFCVCLTRKKQRKKHIFPFWLRRLFLVRITWNGKIHRKPTTNRRQRAKSKIYVNS